MSEEEKKNSLEVNVDKFVKAYLKDVKRFREKYGLNKREAMLLLNRFELAKMHTHLDEITVRIRKTP